MCGYKDIYMYISIYFLRLLVGHPQQFGWNIYVHNLLARIEAYHELPWMNFGLESDKICLSVAMSVYMCI